MKFGVGQSVKRVEDHRMLTGGGRFTDDTAATLYATTLRSPYGHARIVSIDTAGSTNSEGSRELARAFMVAGVPAVLGTLPGADEAATRPLMVGFHRLMSTGIPADEALNTLQRNVLQSNGRRLGAWSALVLYGSDR